MTKRISDKIFTKFLRFFQKNTEKKLIILSYFFYLISYSEKAKKTAKRNIWLFKTKHAYLYWWVKVIKNLDIEVQKKFIKIFYINTFNGKYIKKRSEYKKKYGYNPPHTLVLSITKNCNYNCKGCWSKKYEDTNEVSYNRWVEIIKEAKNDMGIFTYYITGGEPFINENIFNLAKEFSDCLFFVYTNASLLSDKKIDKIKKSGNIYPLISINGIEEENDNTRGEGTYKIAYEKFDKLREAGIFWGISSVASKNNVEKICSYDYLKMLSDKGAFWVWILNFLPTGEKEDIYNILEPEQKIRMHKNVMEVRNTLPIIPFDFYDSLDIGGCAGAGRRIVHIAYNGNVEACPYIHFATHNIKDCSLKEALTSSFLNEIRKNIPYKDGNILRPCLILDRPELLEEYIKKYNPKITQKVFMNILNDEKQRKKLYNNAQETKKIMDKEWENKKYMGLYPKEKEWFYDGEHLCGYLKPKNGKHGGGYPIIVQ